MTGEHTFDGPYGSGVWTFTWDDETVVRLESREASAISLVLSGHKVKDGVALRNAFDLEEDE